MQATITDWISRELDGKPSAFRTPRRITITIPNGVYDALVNRSTEEGRSLGNLAAFLIEKNLDEATRA